MWYLVLLSVMAIAFGIISYYKPLWGIYIITAGLPSFLLRFNIGGVPFTFLEAMILILFLICLLTKRIDYKKIYRNTFFWPIIVVLVFATISVFTAPNLAPALGVWKAYFIEPVLFLAILASQVHSRKALEGLFWALGVSIFYLSIFAIIQKFTGWGVPGAFMKPSGGVDRVVSILNYPNALGLYVGPIIILFTGWLVAGSKRNWPSILKLLVIALGFTAIILAQSEAAIIAVLVCWFIMGIVYKKTRYFTIALAMIAVLVLVFFAGLRDFVLTKVFLNDYSGGIRKIIWHESWKMLKHRWLFGAGLSGYQYHIYPYHLNTFETFPYPHQIVFNFWTELGLWGMLAFVWVFIKYFWVNVKAIIKNPGVKIMAFTFICVGIEIIVHGLVDVPYFKNDLSVLFWIIIGAATINASLFSLEKK
ncbi:MAG: O-antigen ligase family protein [Candidatus Buchananbacteria bacterium]